MKIPIDAMRSISCERCAFPATYWTTVQIQRASTGEWQPPRHAAMCNACTLCHATLTVVRLGFPEWLTFTVVPIDGIGYTLRAIARLTELQRQRILRLFTDFRASEMHVGTAFDLPKGYVAFSLTYHAKQPHYLYGGIDAEGSAST